MNDQDNRTVSNEEPDLRIGVMIEKIKMKKEDRRFRGIKAIMIAQDVVESILRQISALHKGNSVTNVINIIILQVNAFLKRLYIIRCMM